MNTEKIRELLEKAARVLERTASDTLDGRNTAIDIREFLAELDKAQQPGKVMTDERPWMNEWQRNMCKKSKAALIHEIEQERAYCDKLRNEATTGLTVEEIDNELAPVFQAIDWGQTDRAYKLLSGARHRLTAAIEAKHAKP